MSAALAIGQRAWVSARILWGAPVSVKFRGVLQALLAALLLVALISWNPADPSLNAASGAEPTNWLGLNGALFADLFMQSLGLGAWPAVCTSALCFCCHAVWRATSASYVSFCFRSWLQIVKSLCANSSTSMLILASSSYCATKYARSLSYFFCHSTCLRPKLSICSSMRLLAS